MKFQPAALKKLKYGIILNISLNEGVFVPFVRHWLRWLGRGAPPRAHLFLRSCISVPMHRFKYGESHMFLWFHCRTLYSEKTPHRLLGSLYMQRFFLSTPSEIKELSKTVLNIYGTTHLSMALRDLFFFFIRIVSIR